MLLDLLTDTTSTVNVVCLYEHRLDLDLLHSQRELLLNKLDEIEADIAEVYARSYLTTTEGTQYIITQREL